MNNLTTRKIVLGLLMVLVLAFGMLGNADAISRLTRSSGDLQTVTAGNDYQIRFTVGLQSPVRGSDYEDHVQTPPDNVTDSLVEDKRNKNTYYEDDYDGSDPATRGYQSEAQVTYDTAHDYDQEYITISGGTIKRVSSHDVPAAVSASLPMYESTHNSYSTTSAPHQRLSGSVALTLTAPTTADEVTITITPTTDGPGNPDPLVFTIYVVDSLNAGGTTAVASTTDGVERVSDQSDTRIDGDFTFTPGTATGDQPVYYTVEGSGRLYVSPAAPTSESPVADRKTSPTNNLYTSSEAPVFLDTNAGSSKVTAYIAGSSDTATALYTFSGGRLSELPQIAVQSGDGQRGAPEGRLDDYFEVRVTDGKRRPISGLPVTFTRADPSGETITDASMFIPVPGTRVYAAAPDKDSIDATTTVATTTHPEAAETHYVQTDRNGVAKIYYQLSDASGVHTVTATAYGIGIDTTLTATASTTARAGVANLEIVSGNNQRADKAKFLEDDLVVIVRSLAGHRIQDRIIQFRTTTGILVPASGTEQPTLTELGFTTTPANAARNPARGHQIYVKTGANGEAGVTYNVGQLTEAREVVAEVRHEAGDTQYDFAIDRVVFNVNGRASTGGGGAPPPPPVTTRTITVVPSSITGEPGEEVEFSVISTPSTTVQLDSGDLDDDDFSTLLGTGTFTVDLSLPDEEDTYTFTVTSAIPGTGYAPVAVTVTVESEEVEEGTLSIESVGNPANGQQTIRITVRDSGRNLATGDVNVRLTGTGIDRIVPTSRGSGAAVIAVPNTVSVQAEGYRSATLTLTGVGQPTTPTTTTPTTPTPTPTPTTPTVSEPESVRIVGPSTRSGSANTALEAPLLVRVADDDGDAVSEARVIFRVKTGQGRLSERGNGRAVGVQTDANGHARATYTPISARSTVEAEVRGVTRTVAFTITTGSAPPTDDAAATPAQTREYKAGDKIPLSLNDTLRFTGSRTANGTTYTCVGPGECVVSYGILTRGQIRAAATKVPAKTYKVGDKMPISLDDTLSFTGSRTVQGTIYRCVGPGECVISYGILTKGQIQVATVTTPHTTAVRSPVVSATVTSRPPLLWIEEGAIYRLVGATLQRFAPSVSNATSLAIGGNKLYWTVGDASTNPRGNIYSANLDGSGVTKLGGDIYGVPLSITVAGNALYWTDALDRVQRANLDGSGIGNVVRGATNPGDIAIANGRLYWTEAAGGIRSANISGAQRGITNVVTGLGEPLSIAIGGGKIYWLERSPDGSGKLQRANLDGSSIEQLRAFPTLYDVSIAIDGQHLYLTDLGGKIARRNLNGLGYQEVATGLSNPVSIVIGGATAAVAAKPPTTSQTTTTTTTTTTKTTDSSKYDVNGDGTVNKADRDAIAVAIIGGAADAKYDVNGDGSVDVLDVIAVTDNISAGAAAAPTRLGMQLNLAEIDRLQEQIDLLVATDDRSPAAMKVLVYLQQLLATARPEQTQLLANYPNPFNPETWIPYQLATDTEVRLTIYNAQGLVIRTLQLGQQSAGYYRDRERAAYWDGRNMLGEQVASGIYFYQLETDTMSLMRKMVILK